MGDFPENFKGNFDFHDPLPDDNYSAYIASNNHCGQLSFQLENGNKIFEKPLCINFCIKN